MVFVSISIATYRTRPAQHGGSSISFHHFPRAAVRTEQSHRNNNAEAKTGDTRRLDTTNLC